MTELEVKWRSLAAARITLRSRGENPLRNLDLRSAARVDVFERGIGEWFQESSLPITALQDHDSVRSIGITSKEGKARNW